MMGSIYQRGNVKWIKYFRNGQPIRESSHSNIKQEAAALLKIRAGEVASGQVPAKVLDKVPLEELFEDLVADYRIGKRKTWKNQLDLQARIIRLNPGETKNKHGRVVYLDGELFEEMKQVAEQGDTSCPYLFQRDGKRIVNFRRSWPTALKNCDLGGKLFHDLRRTAMRNMVRAGVPETVAQTISGHKTRSVFERYNI